MQVLLGLVRVVPGHLLLEAPGLGVVLDAADLDTHDALERVQQGTGAEAVDRVGPVRAVAQVDGVVVAVGEPEPQQQPPRRLASERVDQLLPQQAHRCRAEDHHALLVQPDDALIRPEVQQFREMQIRADRRGGDTGAGLHGIRHSTARMIGFRRSAPPSDPGR